MRPYLVFLGPAHDTPAEGDLIAHHTRTKGTRVHLVLTARTINHRRTLPDGYNRIVSLIVERNIDTETATEAWNAGGHWHHTYPDRTFA